MHALRYLPICVSVCQSVCPSVCQSVTLSVCLSVCRAVCTSVCPSCYCVKMNGRAHCRTLSTFSYGHHSTLSSPIAVTKFRGKPLGGALNISGGIFLQISSFMSVCRPKWLNIRGFCCCCTYRPLCRKRYEIGLQLLWNPIGSHR